LPCKIEEGDYERTDGISCHWSAPKPAVPAFQFARGEVRDFTMKSVGKPSEAALDIMQVTGAGVVCLLRCKELPVNFRYRPFGQLAEWCFPKN
jgi:hypothetical protein